VISVTATPISCYLATIASTLDKIATEIRHLQRTEVREAEEYFSEKQKGSSAMPHKRNPTLRTISAWHALYGQPQRRLKMCTVA